MLGRPSCSRLPSGGQDRDHYPPTTPGVAVLTLTGLMVVLQACSDSEPPAAPELTTPSFSLDQLSTDWQSRVPEQERGTRYDAPWWYLTDAELAAAAYCWGWGKLGRLGHGSEENALVPVPVGGGHRFAMVAAGGEHTCGLTTEGDVYCWGMGMWGQIGNGRTEDQLLPVRIVEPVS